MTTLQVNKLPVARHLKAGNRRDVALELRRAYEDGQSIRAIAAAVGRSFGNVRQLLVEADTTLRSRGGPRKPRRAP